MSWDDRYLGGFNQGFETYLLVMFLKESHAYSKLESSDCNLLMCTKRNVWHA